MSYEEMRKEALSKISLYSKEWTNYNPSDPGITVLEQLTALSALQGEEFSRVTEEMLLGMLALFGIFRRKGQAAQIGLLLSGESISEKQEAALYFPKGMQFFVHNLCYETDEEINLGENHFAGVFDVNGRRMDSGIFSPEKQMDFRFEQVKQDTEKLILYADIRSRVKRNPFTEKEHGLFATQRWYLRTKEGQKAVRVQDDTYEWMQSGCITFFLPEHAGGDLCICMEQTRQEYERIPEILAVRGPVIEATERKTEISCIRQRGRGVLDIRHALANGGLIRIFSEEENQETSYLKEVSGWTKEVISGYAVRIYLPEEFKEREAAFVIILGNESFLPLASLGILKGWKPQEFTLPASGGKPLPDRILLLAHKETDEGSIAKILDGKEDVLFHIEEESRKLVIDEIGTMEGAALSVCRYSTYHGEEGNVLTDTTLTEEAFHMQWRSVPFGRHGCDQETVEEAGWRFACEMKHGETIVTREDLENRVKAIPGLAIEYVHSMSDPSAREIHLAVKPLSGEENPKLPDVYIRKIREETEAHRLMGSSITICGPTYVPLHFRGVIYVKNGFENGLERVKEFLLSCLQASGKSGFGKTISYFSLYQGILQMDFVNEIFSLSVEPESYSAVKRNGKDLISEYHVIFTLGEILIEFRNGSSHRIV